MSNEANFHFRAQAYMVDIPADLECKDCTIRLLRQALEWSQRYLFWSCADVDIVQPGKYREECSGHGRPIAGRCRCDRLYYGNVQPLNLSLYEPLDFTSAFQDCLHLVLFSSWCHVWNQRQSCKEENSQELDRC